MKKYYVTVNGNRYEVEVEEVKGAFEERTESQTTNVSTSAIEKSEPVKEAPASKTAPKSAPKDGEQINCPMPGTIVSVNIKEGDSIKKGELLFVLEAMKMENEIVSPLDGTILSINVSKGDSVNTDDLLAVIG